ncbi:MAG: glycerol-3-phosphate acyltransferase [Chloroflexi bacterium]|nr:glycerol-3-phosphate acyltransferase [Chloroflexota bacterium]
MLWLKAIGVLAVSYFIGSIPFGYIFVKIKTGRDVRSWHSGRTGTTNALRVAGVWAGLATVTMDILKGITVVWLAKEIFPNQPWMHVFAPLMMIIGHNYSLVMVEHNEKGKPVLRGGAGGAPSVGGAIGLWWPVALIQIPVGAVILLGVGYASVATMSMPLIAAAVFAWRAWQGLGPWAYVVYGLLAEALLLWSLRPNIKRLMAGEERIVGVRAWWRKRKARQRHKAAQQQRQQSSTTNTVPSNGLKHSSHP